MNPPEFTARDAVYDYVQAVLAVTDIYHTELVHCHDPVEATAWLKKRWDIQYTPEQQEAILAKFVIFRLSEKPRRKLL